MINQTSIKKFSTSVLTIAFVVLLSPIMASAQSAESTFIESPIIHATGNVSTFTWNTSSPTTTVLRYAQAPSSAYSGSIVNSPTLVTSHKVEVTLLPSTSYVFYVEGINALGTTSRSAELGFTTRPQTTGTSTDTNTNLDSNNPKLYNLAVKVINGSKYTNIGWTTDEAAVSSIRYSTSPSFSSNNRINRRSVSTRNHTLRIPNLKSNTYYYFKAESKDNQGNIGADAGVVYLDN
jgi:hypothetical protein